MTVSHRNQFLATFQLNSPICRDHYRLTLRIPHFPPSLPGQFVQITCHKPAERFDTECELDWTNDGPPRLCGPELVAPVARLRRPFSIGGRRDAAGHAELDIIHRVVGVGTKWLSHL